MDPQTIIAVYSFLAVVLGAMYLNHYEKSI